MQRANFWAKLIKWIKHNPTGKKPPQRTTVLFLETLEDLTLLNAVTFAPGVGWRPLAADPNPYDASTILVDFVSESAAAASVLPGTSVQATIDLVPGLREIHLAPGLSVATALSAYQASPLVRYAEPNYLVHTERLPNNPLFSQEWGLQKIQAPAAWDVAVGSGYTRVADIDTGIDYNHQSLAANMDANRGYNFINNTNNPYDDNGHGTHTAGTIGAVGDNGVGVVGVNWHVKLMALKFLDANGIGGIADAIRALNYAVAQGVTISNNSWGCYGCYSQGLYDAINNARSIGHIFVAAAGNWASNNDDRPFYPCNYNLTNIICVAATDRNDQLAEFSNYGRNSVHLAAPGVDILSTLPGNRYGTLSGTSMAAPHVTGVMALVRDLHPDWAYSEVIDQVLFTVDRVNSLQGRVKTGGRLNAARAIAVEDWHSSSSRGAVNYWTGNFLVQNLFFQGGDGNLYRHYLDQSGWHWANHGNPGVPLASNPAVANYLGQNRFVYENVFAGGSDGNLYYQYYDPAGWHWVNLGNPGVPLTGDPAVTNYLGGDGFLYENVFVQGSDGQLYYVQYDGGWHWANLGNPGVDLTGNPAVINYRGSNGFLYENVFSQGSDGELYYVWYDGSWHWASLGNPGVSLTGDPAVTNYLGGNGFLYENVFTLGSDGQIYYAWYDGGWHWTNLGNPNGVALVGNPVVINTPGTYPGLFLGEAAFAQGSDGQLYDVWYDGSWHWANNGNPGVPLASDPMVIHSTTTSGSLYPNMFVRASDGNLYQSAGFGYWQNHGNPGSGFGPSSAENTLPHADGVIIVLGHDPSTDLPAENTWPPQPTQEGRIAPPLSEDSVKMYRILPSTSHRQDIEDLFDAEPVRSLDWIKPRAF